MTRIRYGLRAFFLLQAFARPILWVVTSVMEGGGRDLSPLRVLVALLADVPVGLLLLREVARVASPPETRTGSALLTPDWFGGWGDVAMSGVRGLVGAWIFSLASSLVLQQEWADLIAGGSFGDGAPLGRLLLATFGTMALGLAMMVLGWVVGFGERRTTYLPSRCSFFVEGLLVPAWVSAEGARGVSIHVTQYRRIGASSGLDIFQPMVLLASGALLPAGRRTSSLAEAEMAARRSAEHTGLAYVANPALGARAHFVPVAA